MPDHTRLQGFIDVASSIQPQVWVQTIQIQAVQPLIGIPCQIQWEEELGGEEIKDLLTSMEDLRTGRYEVLGPGLTDEEFLMAVHGW